MFYLLASPSCFFWFQTAGAPGSGVLLNEQLTPSLDLEDEVYEELESLLESYARDPDSDNSQSDETKDGADIKESVTISDSTGKELETVRVVEEPLPESLLPSGFKAPNNSEANKLTHK